MNLRPDLKLHLIYGAGIVVYLALILTLARVTSNGVAIGLGSAIAGWAVERYQAIRHEGEASTSDWIASSLPGVVAGLALALWETLA